MGNQKDKIYTKISRVKAASNESSNLPEIQAQIIRKYLSVHSLKGAQVHPVLTPTITLFIKQVPINIAVTIR